MWDWMFGFGWGWMLFGGLLMVLFAGGLIALILLALRGLSGSAGSGSPQRGDAQTVGSRQTPLEILQIRYARGEISREEYEEMKKTLEST